MSGTNVTCTRTTVLLNCCCVKGCSKPFSDNTFFVKHYIECAKAHNLDGSSCLSFDVIQKCCICYDTFSNLLDFSKHANFCASQLANTSGLMAPSVVPKGILTKKDGSD